jgi:hypothetical protein
MINFSMSAPIFLCLPDRVRGMPIFLEILALNAEIPTNRFHEKPPLFIEGPPHLGIEDRNAYC